MKNKRYIRLFKPSVDNYEIRSIGKVFKKAWLGYGGNKCINLKSNFPNLLEQNMHWV